MSLVQHFIRSTVLIQVLRYGTHLRVITQFYLPRRSTSTNGISHTCLTHQPQSITALCLILIFHPAEGGGGVDLRGWLRY